MEEVVEARSPGRSPLVPLAGADYDAQDQSLNVFWTFLYATHR